MYGYINALLLFICFNSYAGQAQTIQEHANKTITTLYHSIESTSNNSVLSRLDWFSAYFKNSPYVLGSLGEGESARYDQYPLYRTDAFDCDTYVNTVLALTLSNSLTTFQRCINNLRYSNGHVSYINRRHFTSLDWNATHQNRGILKDITLSIKDKNHHSVALYVTTPIDKAMWYEHKTLTTIRIAGGTTKLKEQRLAELKDKMKKVPIHEITLPYIPFTALFSTDKKPNLKLFAQIPNGAIIEIIRPHWDLRQEIGTFLDVSHLGFAFWQNNILYFRNASASGKVIDQPLITYLQKATASPTIKGINIQIVSAIPGQC